MLSSNGRQQGAQDIMVLSWPPPWEAVEVNRPKGLAHKGAALPQASRGVPEGLELPRHAAVPARQHGAGLQPRGATNGLVLGGVLSIEHVLGHIARETE